MIDLNQSYEKLIVSLKTKYKHTIECTKFINKSPLGCCFFVKLF